MIRLERKDCGWMLFRDSLDAHAHFERHDVAVFVKDCIKRGILPDQEHLQESCRRLLTDKEYGELVPKQLKERLRKPHGRKR